VSALVALSALSGCSSDRAGPATPTTAVPDRPFDTASTCADEGVSSGAGFDSQSGHYPVYLYSVNTTRQTVAFDVVQIVVGDEAVAAYHRDDPTEPGPPPNGSWLVNALEHTDEAPVASDVRVRLVHYSDSAGVAPTIIPGTLDDILTNTIVGGDRVFWLALRDGVVTQVCRDPRSWDTTPTDANSDQFDPPPGSEVTTCAGAGTTSRTDFDPAGGLYAVYLYGVDTTNETVAFDVVQNLVGDDAARAYHEQHPEDPSGPPNDYLIVNALVRTDEAVVAPGARVRLLHLSGALVGSELGDIRTHPPGGRHPGYGLYWLTFDRYQVTDICQRYTP
jgi:hypothetical protein